MDKNKINNNVEGTLMKNGFFSRRDEIVLSTMTALVVLGLVQMGLAAWYSDGKVQHAMFQKNAAKK